MKHPFLEGLRPTLHIAHRGGAALAPENTMVAFRQAVERWGTDMLEIDVHLTRDGEVVVCHDPTLDRCTDATGPVAGWTWAALEAVDAGYRFTPDGRTYPFRGQGVHIPRLVQVLRAFPDLRLNIELKVDSDDLVGAVVDLLRDEDALDRVCIGAELDRVAAKLHAALPEACYFYPRAAAARWLLGVRTRTGIGRDPRWHVLDVPVSFRGIGVVDRRTLARARRDGLWVNVWTIDDPHEMRWLRALGVGGIMTDRPDLLREVLGNVDRGDRPSTGPPPR